MTDIPVYNEKEISMKDISFRYKSDRRGSNPRSRPWQGRALPTTPLSHIMTVPFSEQSLFYLIHSLLSIIFY